METKFVKFKKQCILASCNTAVDKIRGCSLATRSTHTSEDKCLHLNQRGEYSFQKHISTRGNSKQ